MTLLSALNYMTVGPFIAFVIWLLRRILRKKRGAIADAVYWLLSRFLRRSLQLYLNARHYHRVTFDSRNSSDLPVPGKSGVTLKTDESFVALSLDRAAINSKSYTHANLWDAGSRLRIIGDPGSGKSTLVKRLMRDECRRGMNKPRRSRLPILVNLKEFGPPLSIRTEAQLSAWAINYLKVRVAKVRGYRMDLLFESFAESDTTGVLLLLDGLDEVATADYDRTVAAVNAISNRLTDLGSNNIIVVTMRKNFYEQTRKDLDSTLPQVLTIKPFSANDIYEFITRWPFSYKNHTAKVNRVYGELSDRPNLRDMCRNPLVLAMYVANYEAVGAEELPDTRTEFYAKVSRELLIWRRSRQSGSRIARNTLERQRQKILGKLALQNLQNREMPVNLIRRSDAINAIRKSLLADTDEKAEAIFDEIAKETGITEEEKVDESFRFIHLTFCEYLAAVECVKGDSSGHAELLDLHRQLQASEAAQERSRLVEVIPFACALLVNRSEQMQALNHVAQLGDWELFGRCLLETQAYDHPAWPVYEDKEGAYLHEVPQESWNEEWLSRVQLFRTVLADATACARFAGNLQPPSRAFSAFFSNLVGLNRSKLIALLEGFASRDSSAALRLAEESDLDLLREKPELLVESCVSPAFLSLALERLKASKDQGQWEIVLAEASLRFSVVAQELQLHSADSYIADIDIDPVEYRNRKVSLREGIFSKILQDPKSALQITPMVKLLSLIDNFRRPSSRYFFLSTLMVYVMVLLVLFIGPLGIFADKRSVWAQVLLLSMAIIVLVLMVTVFAHLHKLILWRRISNLREAIDEISEDGQSDTFTRRSSTTGVNFSRGFLSRFTLLFMRPLALVAAAFNAIRSGRLDIALDDWNCHLSGRYLTLTRQESDEISTTILISVISLDKYRIEMLTNGPQNKFTRAVFLCRV